MAAYEVLRIPRHETIRVRNLGLRLTRWGPAPSAVALPVLLLHGWQDCGDTFQFMVDEFVDDRPLVAVDWRGFGRSEWARDGYWFPDYFADLDALLDELSPHAPARIVGHSMGGNIALQYAGLRPDRVRCIASLEGFGMPRTSPELAPGLLRKWLDQVKSAPAPKKYDSVDQLASVIRFRYPRFTAAQANFVAAAWGTRSTGRIEMLGDARHRWVNPVRYQRDDAEACWRNVTAPILLLIGEESEYLPRLGEDGHEASFRKIIPHMEVVRIAGAGHMLHIERADLVAPRVENFLSSH